MVVSIECVEKGVFEHIEDEIIRRRVCASMSLPNRASSFTLYAVVADSLSHQSCLHLPRYSLTDSHRHLLVLLHTHIHEQITLMLRRAVQSALRRPLSTMSTSQTPMEDAIRTKVKYIDKIFSSLQIVGLTGFLTDQRSSEANLYGNLQ